MSDHITVGQLTAQHLGYVVILDEGRGDQRGLPLLSVHHREGASDVFWAYSDGSMASGRTVPTSLGATIAAPTQGGPR